MIRFTNRTITAAAVFATAMTLVVAAPAQAETRSIAVSYADLDLATPAGSAALDRRVRVAVRKVCGPRSLADRLMVDECRVGASAGARRSLAALATAAGTKLASAR